MSLLTRLDRTRSPHGDAVMEKPLLLFDSVRMFLETSDIVKGLDTNPFEVHRALVEYEKQFGTRNVPTKISDAQTNRRRCPHCDDGIPVMDHHEGNEVCDHCGAVLSTGLNFLPSYDTTKNWRPRSKKTSIGGVPLWMVQRTYEERDNNTVESYKEELDHWNHFVNISEDDLITFAHRLSEWHGPSRRARVAAVLLYPDVKSNFHNEQEIRRRVRSAPLSSTTSLVDEVQKNIPKPSFFCPSCGHGMHDRKSAQWHCRTGKRYKRHREV